MSIKKRINKTIYHVFVIAFGILMIYPVLWMISGAFKDNGEILRGSLNLIPQNIKLSNFSTGWSGFGGVTFKTFFKNSFIITITATFGTVLSCSLVAYALARVKFKGRKVWFG